MDRLSGPDRETGEPDPRPVMPPGYDRVLLEPFRLPVDARVLTVAGSPSEVMLGLLSAGRAPAPHGEPLPDPTGSTHERSRVQDLVSSVKRWFEMRRPPSRRYDVVICPIALEDGSGAGRHLERVVRAASRLVDPKGTLVLLADNPWSLGRMLTVPGHTTGDPPAGPGTDRIERALRDRGFDRRCVLLPYPDRRSPRWIVDSRLLEEPDGAHLLGTLVRQPTPALDPGTVLASHPRDAFLAALREGRALEVADAFVVAAARGRADATPCVGDALMWSMEPASRRQGWGVTSELARSGRTWRLRAVEATEADVNGPLMAEPTMVDVPVGANALDLVVTAISRDGAFGAETLRLLEAWSNAARSVLADPSRPRPLDLSPRSSVVTDSGDWRHVRQGPSLAVPVPFEALAYGALLEAITEIVARVGLPGGLSGTLSLDAAARELLRSIGIPCAEEHARLWQAVEADARDRIERDGPGFEAGRDAARDLAAVPLWAFAVEAPLDVQSRALRDGRHAAMGTELRDRLAAMDVEIQGLRRDLDLREAQLPAAQRELADVVARSDALQATLVERWDEVERLRAELTWRGWQLQHEKAMLEWSLPGPDGRSPMDNDLDAVRASGLFDAQWYLARYPDIATAEIDPLSHWVRFGVGEGRDPGPAFRTKAYVMSHRDDLAPGMNPLLHFDDEHGGGDAGGDQADPERVGVDDPGLLRAADTSLRDLGSIAAAMDDLLRELPSDREYMMAIRQDEPWLEAAGLICRSVGIEPDGPPEHISHDSRAPVILVPPDHVVKLYPSGRPRKSDATRLARGQSLYDVEVAALERVRRDPSFPAPRLVSHGPIGAGWRYVIMTRVPGIPFEDVRGRLPPSELRVLATWVGAFVRRLHAIPISSEERATGWARFSALASFRLGGLPERLQRRGTLPRHLVAQLATWMPPLDELLGPPDQAVIVHGDLLPKHVLGTAEGETFRPTGVVDLNESMIGNPLYDLGHMWWCSLGADRDLRDAFLAAAGFPRVGEPGFPRLALAWSLLRTCSMPPPLPGIAEVGDLDTLAELSFGVTAGPRC